MTTMKSTSHCLMRAIAAPTPLRDLDGLARKKFNLLDLRASTKCAVRNSQLLTGETDYRVTCEH